MWERAATVLERADQLPEGGSFAFRMELHPRALMNYLHAQRPGRFAFENARLAEEDWSVTIRRIPVALDNDVRSLFVRSPILAKLSSSARRALVPQSRELKLRRGDVIAQNDAPRENLHVLLEGVAGVFCGSDTRERLLFDIHAAELTGEIELFDGGLPLGRTIVLSRTARIAAIPFAALTPLLEREHAFTRTLASAAAQHVRALAASLTQQTNQPILERVAIALLPYATPERGLVPAAAPIASMTQTQVAAAAGTVKEVAARAIAELERTGALRRERGHIAYLDRTKLLEIIDQS